MYHYVELLVIVCVSLSLKEEKEYGMSVKAFLIEKTSNHARARRLTFLHFNNDQHAKSTYIRFINLIHIMLSIPLEHFVKAYEEFHFHSYKAAMKTMTAPCEMLKYMH